VVRQAACHCLLLLAVLGEQALTSFIVQNVQFSEVKVLVFSRFENTHYTYLQEL